MLGKVNFLRRRDTTEGHLEKEYGLQDTRKMY